MSRYRKNQGQEIVKEYETDQIIALIDNHIHNAVYRQIMKDRLIDGIHYEALAEKYNYSTRHIKRIVYSGMNKIADYIK